MMSQQLGISQSSSKAYSFYLQACKQLLSVYVVILLTCTRRVAPACHATSAGHDIACDQTDWQGKPAAFCQICNGFDNVLNACSNHKDCIAFDMDWGSNCGYLKASKGPLKYPAPGFTSYILGNTNSGNAASSSETVSGFTSMAEANIQGKASMLTLPAGGRCHDDMLI
jgi:hypothetical protein